MEAVVVGLVALVAGFVFCFSGYLAFRVVIPLWGAFAGFSLGAGVVAAVTGDSLLAKPVGWLVGLGVALVFALLAYLYFEVAVVITMGSLGFLVGSGVMVALGVGWNWLVTLIAMVAGVVFAFVAIVTNMPRILLVLVSSVAGSLAMVGGLMLLGGTLEVEDLTHGYVTERIHDDWWWYVVYVVLLVAGIVVQSSRHAEEDPQRSWDTGAGRRPAT